jgi:hypothetical protein
MRVQSCELKIDGVPKKSLAPEVPRQHGAWTSLLVSFVVGAAAGNWTRPELLLLLGAGIAAFFARQSAVAWMGAPEGDPRRARAAAWTALAAAAGAGCGLWLVARTGVWPLIPAGGGAFLLLAATVAFERRRQFFTPMSEAAGFLGLSLMAPAAEMVAAGAASARTAAVWALAAAFFAGGLFRVRYLVRRRAQSMGMLPERLRAGAASLAVQAAGLAATAALAFIPHALPATAVSALLPGALQAAVNVARRRASPAPVRSVGRLELAHGVLFTLLAAAALRSVHP